MSISRLGAVLLSLAMTAGAADGVRAQVQPPSPEGLQVANELFSILSKDMLQQLVSQLTAQFWPPVERSLRGKYPQINDATIAELRAEFERIQVKNLTLILADAPAIYARHFTVQELREMLAFNRSPTGQKALRVLPQVMGEFTASMVPKLKDMEAQTMDAFNNVLRQRGFPI
jgi:uncharacterized protein